MEPTNVTTPDQKDYFCTMIGDQEVTHLEPETGADFLALVFQLCSPCSLLLFLLPFNILLAKRKGHRPLGREVQGLRIALTLLVISTQSWSTYTNDEEQLSVQQSPKTNGYLWTSLRPVGAYLFVLVLKFLEKLRSSNLTVPLFVFWSTTLVSLVSNVFQKEMQDSSTWNQTWLFDCVHIGAVFVQCCLYLVTARTSEKEEPTEEYVHPKSTAGWLNDCLLMWTLGLIRTGSKKTLEETDVCDLQEKDQCRNAVSIFERGWKVAEFQRDLDNQTGVMTRSHEKSDTKTSSENEKADSEKDGVPLQLSLLRVLVKTFGVKFFFLQFIKGFGELSGLISPILMKVFMEYIQNRENEHWLRGVGIVFTMFAFNSASTVFHHRIWCTINRLQKQMRSSIMMCVYKKALVVKNDCTKDITTGEIVNLISDDCDRVINMSQHMFFIVSTPLMIGASLYLLQQQVGSAMYVGLLIIIVLIPVNRWIGEKLKNIHLGVNDNREKRSKLMNEIINGIQVLKLYAWEPSFMKKVTDIRDEEDRLNNSKSFLLACVDSMFRAIPFLVKLGAFGAYLLLGGHMDAATVFPTMELFGILNHPFSLMALLIPGYVEAVVSLKRITKFLNGENIPQDIVDRRRKGKSAITINKGIFSWERESPKVNLRDIDVNIPKGGLVAIVGKVGSGKSSLLSAMLGEMEKFEGDVEVQGRVAYVPQEAWMLNTSLQENVLFGSSYDASRYKRVVHGCSLKHDINLMPAGERTEIGEKGINLSGGQKQRVSLARAVYKDADVYLLDDPLSAVDAHVGKHIFNKVLGHKGMLKGKTRVLVTHGIHWLPFVDSIIFIKDGTISETGSYEQLTSRDGALSQFLRDILAHKTEVASLKETKFRKKIMTRLDSINNDQENENSDTVEHSTRELADNELFTESSSSDSNNESDKDVDALENGIAGDKDKTSGAFIDDEDMEQGQVSKTIYLEYLKAVGYKLVLTFTLVFSITSLSDVLNSDGLKQWTDDPLLSNASLAGTSQFEEANWSHFKNFAITGALEVISSFIFVNLILKGTFKAATRLHNQLLNQILRCPMSFFDSTPSVRIILRFTKDISRVDGLGGCLRGLILQFLNMCTFITMIVIYCPTISVYILAISVVYVFLFGFHIGSLRQLRRFRSKYRSPMYAHFTETLNGRTSVRAYSTQKRFIKAMEEKIDDFTKFELWELWVNLGLAMRSTLLCNLLGLMTGLVCVMDGSMTAGMVGLVVMYAGGFSHMLKDFLHTMTHTETEIVALERVIDYTKKPSEAEWEIEDTKPAADWPSNGEIVFDNYQTRYREGSELILKGLHCRIESGQKVGIVGRTGAGKSTLTNAFFRILEAADGKISIDDTNIADIGLHDLRSRINILPQDPVVFSGTLKMNLDPFERSTEDDLWEALRHAHLAPFVEELPGKLDFQCGEGGKNLSVGQRQLLCMARALLRMNKILVLDEATAAVDMETDELIQKTIRTAFKGCTVLTIAHRLNTIMDYDKILVMDSGLVKEFDSPANLLADTQSVFYGMAKDANLVH